MELDVIETTGLRAVLPDRLGPDPRGALRRRDRRAGTRQLGRFAGRVRPAHHQRLPAQVRAHLRALPQHRARPDAGHRHRLRRPPPRPGAAVRAGQVRRGPGGADHHLRHHGGSRGHPRRGPRAQRAAARRRPARQARPAEREDHARQGARREQGAARAVRQRGVGAAGHRQRAPSRGHLPQRVDARCGGGDRRRTAHQHRPPSALDDGRPQHRGDHVRHGGGLSGRPAQGRLPRADQPHRHRGEPCR